MDQHRPVAQAATHTCTAPGCTTRIVTPAGRVGLVGRPRTRCSLHTRARTPERATR